MIIFEWLKSLFWTPPAMPDYRPSHVLRISGVGKFIRDVSEYFYAEGWKDGWIAATATYAMILAMGTIGYLFISRRNDATAR